MATFAPTLAVKWSSPCFNRTWYLVIDTNFNEKFPIFFFLCCFADSMLDSSKILKKSSLVTNDSSAEEMDDEEKLVIKNHLNDKS